MAGLQAWLKRCQQAQQTGLQFNGLRIEQAVAGFALLVYRVVHQTAQTAELGFKNIQIWQQLSQIAAAACQFGIQLQIGQWCFELMGQQPQKGGLLFSQLAGLLMLAV